MFYLVSVFISEMTPTMKGCKIQPCTGEPGDTLMLCQGCVGLLHPACCPLFGHDAGEYYCNARCVVTAGAKKMIRWEDAVTILSPSTHAEYYKQVEEMNRGHGARGKAKYEALKAANAVKLAALNTALNTDQWAVTDVMPRITVSDRLDLDVTNDAETEDMFDNDAETEDLFNAYIMSTTQIPPNVDNDAETEDGFDAYIKKSTRKPPKRPVEKKQSTKERKASEMKTLKDKWLTRILKDVKIGGRSGEDYVVAKVSQEKLEVGRNRNGRAIFESRYFCKLVPMTVGSANLERVPVEASISHPCFAKPTKESNDAE